MYVQTGGIEIYVLLSVVCANYLSIIGRLGDPVLLVGSGRTGRVRQRSAVGAVRSF